MTESQITHLENRQWRLFLIYNAYRLISVALFLGVFIYSPVPHEHFLLYGTILFLYFLCILFFIYLWQSRSLSYFHQVLFSGTVDIVAISAMLGIIGNLYMGYGILLIVTVAALGILIPGKIAIFFAALASSSLLLSTVIHFIGDYSYELDDLYYCGVYGAGFFAIALTAWYLANRLKDSETIAQSHSEELAGIVRINEYIVERLNTGIIYVDKEKKIKLINSATRSFFHIPIQLTPESLPQISSELTDKFDEFVQQNKSKNTTAQCMLEDLFLKIHFIFNDLAPKPAVLIFIEDMTQVAQQAQQLKLAALGRFSASIAHELRNPLGAIAHAVQLLGDKGDLGEEDSHLKQMVINNCDRMNRVIKNVLQLSRQQKAQPEIIEVGSFLKQFKQDFCVNNVCDFTIDLPKEQPVSIVFDKSQFDQVLIILCDNAMKHGHDDQGKVKLTFAVELSDNKLLLSVRDQGSGVIEKDKDCIFEPFFTTLRSGTGMGLFIARDLCEINQARLNLIASKKGSCFVITSNLSGELVL